MEIILKYYDFGLSYIFDRPMCCDCSISVSLMKHGYAI